MKLYTYFQSSASYRVRIALNLKGIKPEMVFVNLLKGEQTNSDYDTVNPQHAVPALIDGNHTLIQSLAIMEYLEETHPTPPLLPDGPFARAAVRALAGVIACDTSPLGNLSVRKYLEKTMHHAKDDINLWMQHWIENGLAAFERTLVRSGGAGKYCFGDAPTMADCCLMPQVFNAIRWKCDLAPYPLISRIANICDSHPAFAAAHPARQPDAI